MPQEIKLKVSMHSQKCRKQVMQVVAKLSGVDKVSVDLEKEIVVVIGEVDPVCVATHLRKKRKVADIVSVGPFKNKGKDGSIPIATMYSSVPYYGGYGHVVGYPTIHHDGGCNIL